MTRHYDAALSSLSPDGRLLAYQSFAAGTWQIRILELATRRQWTVDNGFAPVWSLDGRALLYQEAGALRVMDVAAGAGFQAGAIRSITGREFAIDCCAIHRRDRLLVSELVKTDAGNWISVVVNWPTLMTAKAGR